MRGIISGAALCACTLASATASASPKTHDGFHLQLQTGFGYYNTSTSNGGVDESLSGMTIPMSLLLGGTPMDGLVIGGGFFVDTAPSVNYEQNGQSMELSGVKQYVVGLGIYGDYYLDPKKGGLHFQGFLGWGGLETSSGGNAGGSDPTGLVVAAGGGYDVWIANEWSVGGMLRLAYGPFKFNNATFNTIAPALLVTLTYH
jgi:hypothetical protein